MALEPWLIVPDCHIPYEDKRAWDLMLAVAADVRPIGVITLGDFWDAYCISTFSKDPSRERSLEREAGKVRARRRELEATHVIHRVFLGGNHEDRLRRYIADKAPELFETVTIPAILGLDEGKWTYVPYKESYRLGKLYLTHDVGAYGRNVAQRLLDTFQHNAVCGHAHRLSHIVEGNAVGESHSAMSLGWLGDVRQVDYAHRVKALREWALAFGLAYHDTKTGFVYVQPVPIVTARGRGYSAVVNGKQYHA